MSDPRDDLPFLANDTLRGAGRRAAERAVAADPALARELDALRRVRATMRAEPLPEGPGEAGLARLMDAVEREAGRDAPAPANDDRAPRLWRAAAAVLLAVALGQAAWIASRPAASPEGYLLADGGLAGGGRADGGEAIRVAFAPDATEAGLRALLEAAGVVVVDGPSALGLWSVAPVREDGGAGALAVLRASPLVEDVDPPR